jgi:competence protein ComEA
VEQQSAPWRVFDAPAADGPEASRPNPDGQAGGAPSLVGQVNRRVVIAGLVGAAVIVVLAVVIAASGTSATTIDGPESAIGADGSDVPLAAPGRIVVDVAGAVVKPGLYRLDSGARVGDAIEAAGGFNPRVDVERVGSELNLAAVLSDGAQVRVPSRDEAAPGDAPGGGSGGGGSEPGLVNLNTATESELDALSGIGPVTAGKIIESRAGSPFRTVDELRERGLVGEKTFEKIRALLTVR